MKVTILGFSGGLQAADTANTSFILSDEKTSILVDASGSPVNSLLRNGYDPATFDAVVLTHAHVDHIYAFPSLLHSLWLSKREKPLIVLGNPHTIEKAKALYELFLLNEKKMMEIRWLTECSKIGTIDITAFPLFHRPKVPTNGFVFESGKKLAYFPDSAATPPYPDAARNADLVIHEAGGLDKDRERLRNDGHSSALQAGELARDINARRLLLVHLPKDEDLRKRILYEARSIFPDTSLPSNDLMLSL